MKVKRQNSKAHKSVPKASRTKRRVVIIIAVLMLLAGIYILFLLVSPKIVSPAVTQKWNKPVAYSRQELTENRLYIPRLKLNLTYKSGNQSVLSDNLWHRSPERGNPEKGGNFILAGHRFELGLTPGETNRKSPLYHINKLEIGDKIYADYDGKRYEYQIAERMTVKPTQTEIEAPSEEAKLTLYTCTLQGAADGREVIVARLTRSDIDPATTF